MDEYLGEITLTHCGKVAVPSMSPGDLTANFLLKCNANAEIRHYYFVPNRIWPVGDDEFFRTIFSMHCNGETFRHALKLYGESNINDITTRLSTPTEFVVSFTNSAANFTVNIFYGFSDYEYVDIENMLIDKNFVHQNNGYWIYTENI